MASASNPASRKVHFVGGGTRIPSKAPHRIFWKPGSDDHPSTQHACTENVFSMHRAGYKSFYSLKMQPWSSALRDSYAEADCRGAAFPAPIQRSEIVNFEVASLPEGTSCFKLNWRKRPCWCTLVTYNRPHGSGYGARFGSR